ncbi:MAG: hypothetical protein WBA17_17370 [Saprospiraceae bacterium]
MVTSNSAISFSGLFSLLLLILLFGSGCDPDEPTPAILLIPRLTFTAGADQGSASADIREAWVTVDGVFLGAYPTPARVPVLATGTARVRVQAGIRESGVSTLPQIYPFYTEIERDLEFAPGRETELGTGAITYRSDTRFAFIEDFENGTGRVFTSPFVGAANFEPTTEDVFEGSFSGLLELDTAQVIAQIATELSYSGLTDSPQREVYLEMNFRSERNALWGIIGRPGLQLQTLYDVGFRPRSEWTKIYFNLGPTIIVSNYQIYGIAVQVPDETGVTGGKVFVDNIKLLHF